MSCRLCYIRFFTLRVCRSFLYEAWNYLVFLLVYHVLCQYNKVRYCHCLKNINFASVLLMSLSVPFHTLWQYATFFIHMVNRTQSRQRSIYKKDWPWLGQFFVSCHSGGLSLIPCHFVCDLCCLVWPWESFSPIFWCFRQYYSTSVPYSFIKSFLFSFIHPFINSPTTDAT